MSLHLSTVRRYIRRGLLEGWRRGGDARIYVDLEKLRELREFRPAPDEPYEPDPVTGPQNTGGGGKRLLLREGPNSYGLLAPIDVPRPIRSGRCA